MRPPRFPIVWVMVFVALAELKFGAIRAVTDYRGATRDSFRVAHALPGARAGPLRTNEHCHPYRAGNDHPHPRLALVLQDDVPQSDQ